MRMRKVSLKHSWNSGYTPCEPQTPLINCPNILMPKYFTLCWGVTVPTRVCQEVWFIYLMGLSAFREDLTRQKEEWHQDKTSSLGAIRRGWCWKTLKQESRDHVLAPVLNTEHRTRGKPQRCRKPQFHSRGISLQKTVKENRSSLEKKRHRSYILPSLKDTYETDSGAERVWVLSCHKVVRK